MTMTETDEYRLAAVNNSEDDDRVVYVTSDTRRRSIRQGRRRTLSTPAPSYSASSLQVRPVPAVAIPAHLLSRRIGRQSPTAAPTSGQIGRALPCFQRSDLVTDWQRR